MQSKKDNSSKLISKNRKAFHNYDILERLEAGIELQGTEVKSLRAGKINLLDSYVTITDGQMFVHHIHISPFEHGSHFNHDPYRKRKLLLHKKEIFRLGGEMARKKLTIVPLSIYFHRQWVKVEIGLCRGRKKYDNRDKIATKESKQRIKMILNSSR